METVNSIINGVLDTWVNQIGSFCNKFNFDKDEIVSVVSHHVWVLLCDDLYPEDSCFYKMLYRKVHDELTDQHRRRIIQAESYRQFSFTSRECVFETPFLDYVDAMSYVYRGLNDTDRCVCGLIESGATRKKILETLCLKPNQYDRSLSRIKKKIIESGLR